MINLVKLTNGEMIVGDVIDQTDSHLSIKDPLEVKITYLTGAPSIIATFWIPISDKGTIQDIRQQHIIAVAEVNEEIESYYIRSLEKIVKPYKTMEEIELEENYDLVEENLREEYMDFVRQRIANTSGGMIH